MHMQQTLVRPADVVYSCLAACMWSVCKQYASTGMHNDVQPRVYAEQTGKCWEEGKNLSELAAA